MIVLNSEQCQQVVEYLATSLVRKSLQDDLVDQLCCEIEAQMNRGADFPTAFASVTQAWRHKKIRSIDRSITFETKTKPMMTKMLTFATLIVGLLWLSPPMEQPQIALNQPSPESATPVERAYLDPEFTNFDPPTASPLKGVKLADAHSAFGMRMHPLKKKKMMHTGIDFKADIGTPVHATADGKVISSGNDGPHGIRVIIEHADGYTTAYSHLSTATVKESTLVKLGDQIGKVGNTGKSTGPHLHYEVRKENKAINPLARL